MKKRYLIELTQAEIDVLRYAPFSRDSAVIQEIVIDAPEAAEPMTFATTMGFDAMRIAFGRDPLTHTREEVVAYLETMNELHREGSAS